ncbi:hypothetical protein PCCS19_30020 [Paenibacillus sp. CCS19]|uniref:non-ribosomal peptide synthetase n=1 Tax=Paenibacillus sp. CCS19 TaxID=3158387 RepID=UPI00255FEC9F|nr:non-ribosomal peptide synthetase [Paenibacillus cellulosilyticus]GMK39947.1 hypothetical protein PCCS19_30020 [Paenibacillus cellulosilyticus]
MKTSQIENIYELTPVQRGMLFHSINETDSELYVAQFRYTLQGTIKEAAFERSWNTIVQRHPVLRSAFVWEAVEKPLQIVFDHVDIPIAKLDWRHLSTDEQHSALQRFVEEDRKQGFDITNPPLMRLTLISLGQDSCHLVWTTHHLLLDGWSLGILSKELFACYRAYSQSAEPELAPVMPFSYYVNWLQSQDEAAAQSYWEQALSGFNKPTALQIGQQADTADAVIRIDEQSFMLSADATSKLVSFTREHRITLNTAIQGVWAHLLSVYSGDKDVVFGATVSGRPASLPRVDEVVGMTINTIPVRIQLHDGESITAMLSRIQREHAEALQYEFTPLSSIQRWSPLPAGVQLFQSIVVFENFPIDESLTERAKDIGLVDIDATVRTNFPLTITVVPGERLFVRMEYDIQRFSDSDVNRLLKHMGLVLETIAQDSTKLAAELPSTTLQERTQMLAEWGEGPSVTAAEPQLIHRSFAAQAKRTPEAVAIVDEQGEMTYRELDRRSDVLAMCLAAKGIGPDMRVGLCADRSSSLIVGMLGILKAGGAYVPLDPAYPQERLAFMLEDSSASVLVTERGHEQRFANYRGDIVLLDGLEAVAGADADTDADAGAIQQPALAEPHHLAYVMYTSGSTGQPKGVMIEHRNVMNYVAWAAAHYRGTEGTGAPVHSSLAFDLTVTSVLVPLLSGTTVRLLPEGKRLAAEELADTLRGKADYTLVKLTPAHLGALGHLLSEADGAESARTLVIGGEQLLGEQLRYWRNHAPNIRLINEYGPTETTVGCCIYEVQPQDPSTGAVPIGRPIANTRLYILDERMQPVPVGVQGELYIGGAGVARGYLNRPELTEQRFVPDPFDAEGGRLYKTGDLARYRMDGVIEYLGRMDDQVKIRGYRVELGEVEAALVRCPGIREGAAAVRTGPSGEKLLAAYLVQDDEAKQGANAATVREWLKERLPEHMVPTTYTFMDQLPLTVNGKVDRSSLPNPEAPPEQAESEAQQQEAPRTELEKKLAGIWSEVLGLPQIGLRDNFFELGGDSILGIQIVAKAHKQGIHFSPTKLYSAPSIAELSVALSEEIIEAASVEAEDQAERKLLTPIQRWFFETEGIRVPNYYNQCMLVEAQIGVRYEGLQAAVAALIEHHDALRFAYRKDDSTHEWYAEIAHVHPELLCIRIDLSQLTEEEQAASLVEHSERLQSQLQLERGSLFQAVWFDCGHDRPSQVLFIAHHLVTDGVSWRILLEDLAQAYEQYEQGMKLALPGKTTSLHAWSKHLIGYASSLEMLTEQAYWTSPEGAASALTLDMPEGTNEEASALLIREQLSEEETLALLQQIPKLNKLQMNDLLLAALWLTYRHKTGSSTLHVEMEGHGREDLFDHADLSRTVGWFTSTYPLSLHVDDREGEGALLRQVKEQLRKVPNKGIGYGVLRYLHPDESVRARLRNRQKPQIILNYLGQFDQHQADSSRFSISQHNIGRNRHASTIRTHELHLDGFVLDKKLHLILTYSANQFYSATMEGFMASFKEQLQRLISYCLSTEETREEEQDFLSQMNQNDLLSIMKQIQQAEGE